MHLTRFNLNGKWTKIRQSIHVFATGTGHVKLVPGIFSVDSPLLLPVTKILTAPSHAEANSFLISQNSRARELEHYTAYYYFAYP